MTGGHKGFAIGASKAYIPLLLAIIAWIGSGISATAYAIGAIASMHAAAIMAWTLAYLAYAIQVHWMFFRVGTFKFYTALLFPGFATILRSGFLSVGLSDFYQEEGQMEGHSKFV